MRIAPILGPHLSTPSPRLWADATLSAMLTHNDSASTASCVAFVSLLWEILAEGPPSNMGDLLDHFLRELGALESRADYVPRGGVYSSFVGSLCEYTRMVIDDVTDAGYSTEQALNRCYSGAYMLETVPSVLYILVRHGHDPEEAIIRAVNDTKDNDTIAAIVGAAVGALHGRDGLPSRWIDGLLGRLGSHDDGHVFKVIDSAAKRWWHDADR
jgi:ADP-ribosylglycohydrolase